MFPDFGHDWPLFEEGIDTYTMTPADYDLSPELTAQLRFWHDEWQANFDPNANPPSWRGTTRAAWGERGRELAEQLRSEVSALADVKYEGLVWY
jgi:hypothetical protein